MTNRTPKTGAISFWTAIIALVYFPSVAAEWRYVADDDPFNDRPIHRAIYTRDVATSDASILVRCDSDLNLEVFVDPGDYVGGNSPRVMWRIDKEESVEESWSISTQGTSVVTSNPILAWRMARGSQLTFRAYDFSGTPITVSYPLAGAIAAISPVLAACNLRKTEPSNSTESIYDIDIPGVPPSIIDEVIHWGEQSLKFNAKFLCESGWLAFPCSTEKSDEIYIAANEFKKKWVAACRSGELDRQNDACRVCQHYDDCEDMKVSILIQNESTPASNIN